jgi:glycosyltransferase involved in cell wall biosynthesis
MAQTIFYITPSVELLGARVSLVELLRNLDRSRFRPVVIGHRHGPLLDKLKDLDIQTHIVRFGNWRKIKHWPLIPFVIKELTALGKKYDVKLWHSNEFWSFPYARLAADKLNVPALTHFRCSRTEEQISPRKIKNYLLPKADLLIAVSKAQKHLFHKFPDMASRITVIHNGVDVEQFDNADGHCFRQELNADENRLLIGIVGPVSLHKGIEDFIRAARIICNHYPDALFAIVGPERPHAFAVEMQSLSAQLGLDKNIIFTGFRKDIPEIMSGLDLLITPSHIEAFGRVILEAMAAGTPVIASNVGGVPEIISSPDVGILTPPQAPTILADTILKLLADKEDAFNRIVVQARAHVQKHFSINEHTTLIESIYNQFLK